MTLSISEFLKNEEEKYIVSCVWKRFGGSFCSSLAEALDHADPVNTSKIKTTFKEYWDDALQKYERTRDDFVF